MFLVNFAIQLIYKYFIIEQPIVILSCLRLNENVTKNYFVHKINLKR